MDTFLGLVLVHGDLSPSYIYFFLRLIVPTCPYPLTVSLVYVYAKLQSPVHWQDNSFWFLFTCLFFQMTALRWTGSAWLSVGYQKYQKAAVHHSNHFKNPPYERSGIIFFFIFFFSSLTPVLLQQFQIKYLHISLVLQILFSSGRIRELQIFCFT